MHIEEQLISNIYNHVSSYLYNKNKLIDPSLGYLSIEDLFGIVRDTTAENGINIKIELTNIECYVYSYIIFELMNTVLLEIEELLKKVFNIPSSKLLLNYQIK